MNILFDCYAIDIQMENHLHCIVPNDEIDISVGSPEEDDDCNPERKSHCKASKAPAWILPEIKTNTVSKYFQSGM